jgi:hypothetical protein
MTSVPNYTDAPEFRGEVPAWADSDASDTESVVAYPAHPVALWRSAPLGPVRELSSDPQANGQAFSAHLLRDDEYVPMTGDVVRGELAIVVSIDRGEQVFFGSPADVRAAALAMLEVADAAQALLAESGEELDR